MQEIDQSVEHNGKEIEQKIKENSDVNSKRQESPNIEMKIQDEEKASDQVRNSAKFLIKSSSISAANLKQIKQGNVMVKYTDKRAPLERMEAERILNNHAKKLEQIKLQDPLELGKQFKRAGESCNIQQQLQQYKQKSREYQFNRKYELIAKDNELLLKKLVDIQAGKRTSVPKAKSNFRNNKNFFTIQKPQQTQSDAQKIIQTSIVNKLGAVYDQSQTIFDQKVQSDQDQEHDTVVRFENELNDEHPPQNQKPKKLEKSNNSTSQQQLLTRNIISQSASVKSLNHFKKREIQDKIERENLKIAQKIFQMKPSIRAQDHQIDYKFYRNLGLAMRKIQKKIVPILDGRIGHLPPINTISEQREEKDVTSLLRSQESVINSLTQRSNINDSNVKQNLQQIELNQIDENVKQENKLPHIRNSSNIKIHENNQNKNESQLYKRKENKSLQSNYRYQSTRETIQQAHKIAQEDEKSNVNPFAPKKVESGILKGGSQMNSYKYNEDIDEDGKNNPSQSILSNKVQTMHKHKQMKNITINSPKQQSSIKVQDGFDSTKNKNSENRIRRQQSKTKSNRDKSSSRNDTINIKQDSSKRKLILQDIVQGGWSAQTDSRSLDELEK